MPCPPPCCRPMPPPPCPLSLLRRFASLRCGQPPPSLMPPKGFATLRFSAAIGGRLRRHGVASPSHRPRPSQGSTRQAFYHRDRRSPEATPSSLLPPHHGHKPPLRPYGAHSLRSPPTAGRLMTVVAASPSHRPSGCVGSYLAQLYLLSFLRYAPPPIPFLHSSEKE